MEPSLENIVEILGVDGGGAHGKISIGKP